MAVFTRREAPLDWRQLAATTVRAILASAAMAAIVLVVLAKIPKEAGLASQLTQVGVPILLGAAAYCGAYLLLGGRELGMLWSGRAED